LSHKILTFIFLPSLPSSFPPSLPSFFPSFLPSPLPSLFLSFFFLRQGLG
jgi:hypothetical protein